MRHIISSNDETATYSDGTVRKLADVVLPRPHGYGIAGSGWSRYYTHLTNAQKAHARLTAKGYTAGVITHSSNPRSMQYMVLVERYRR